jgi:hypothetical protein
MTDQIPEDWVLIEAAKRGSWCESASIEQKRDALRTEPLYRALCDMIAKHEQKPVDRKLLCAQQAYMERIGRNMIEEITIRAIELWEEGFGK